MPPTPASTSVAPVSGGDLRLTINGKIYSLGPDVPASTSLLRYIRDFALLPGTKALCYEGGCGACAVVAIAPDAESTGHKMFSINSCQTLVYACAGWAIRTIEHLGTRSAGYSKLQTALHGFYGTQCGYCTPGFIMTMHGQLQKSNGLKMGEIEKSLDGNICRCTGYRPILDAFKSFGSDAPKELTCRLQDIEEVYNGKCSKTGEDCNGVCHDSAKGCEETVFSPSESLSVERNGVTWHRPTTMQDIYDVLNRKQPGDKIHIVVGNTGSGVFKNSGPYNIYVNTTGVKELYKTTMTPTITLGANVSLNRCIEVFHSAAREMKGYKQLEEVAKHWEYVANVAVRNSGSWGGNLMMKHAHPEFCSDIFIALVAIDATITITNSNGAATKVSAEKFLSLDMSQSIVSSMDIPPQPEDVILTSYKITPRAVNAHAYVNAFFKLRVNRKDQFKVMEAPTIVMGGISPTFVRATETEKYLCGRHLSNSDDVNSAIECLGKEVNPVPSYVETSPEHRRSLAKALLYKTILKIRDDSVNAKAQSGGQKMERPVSSSRQMYDANEDMWPVGQALPKLESKNQISGEAEYLDDMPVLPNELFGAFVQSTIARGKIKSIDTSECMNLAGVVDFTHAKDIPGKNSFFPSETPDPVFAEKVISYAGQSIGLVVATSREIAATGAALVRVHYEDVQTPILTIEGAIKENKVKKHAPFVFGDVKEGFKTATHILEGEMEMGPQFHFMLEPLASRVVPVEDGYDVYCTTQWPSMVQGVVADVLGIPGNSINMSIRRIGGGFGGKISRANVVAAAAAVAACKLHRPVRITLDLTTHMTLAGWRETYLSKYKVGFGADGRLAAVDMDVIVDAGHVPNESGSQMACPSIPSTYFCPHWNLRAADVTTNTAAATWCRTPAHVNAIAFMENLIERISHHLGMSPEAVRQANFSGEENPRQFGQRKADNLVRARIFPELLRDAQVEARRREVLRFNEANRWKKRGLGVIPLRYGFDMIPFFQYNVQVVIYEHDGTVAIKHGGVEMGQGINTKVVQVAARTLGVPMDLIKIKPTDLFAGANSVVTGGSFGSDLNPHGVKICCDRIRARMDAVKKGLMTAEKGATAAEKGKPTWAALVKACFDQKVDICERYFTYSNEHPKGYDIWGAACLEVEIDVLTGQYLILRADVVEDCGRSLSPYVDMGQVEGALVMGIGLLTSEKVKLHPETGQKLSNGTWEYKPPTALDIPIDFRVSFLPKGDNPNGGILKSKATGEPAVCLSYSVICALRQAIQAARTDAGHGEWFEIDTPLTVEKIHQLCNVGGSLQL